jgi:hypothetical protein
MYILKEAAGFMPVICLAAMAIIPIEQPELYEFTKDIHSSGTMTTEDVTAMLKKTIMTDMITADITDGINIGEKTTEAIATNVRI